MTTTTKKLRVLARLVTAFAKGEWVSRKELLKITDKGHLARILAELKDRDMIEVSGARGSYLYKANDKLRSKLEEGQLPRTTQKKERPRAIEVGLRPIGDYIDVGSAWMEHMRASVRLDRYTADLIRTKCDPPGARDRAQQYSHSAKGFSISVSRRGTCMLVLKELDWLKDLSEFLRACGLSEQGSLNAVNQVSAQLPEAFKRVEMPVIQRGIKARRLQFVVRTRVGEDWVESNINYSTDVDMETLGTTILVDNWLAVLAATQHNSVAVFEALQNTIAEFKRKSEELQKEQEKKQQAEGEKKEAQYIG